MPMSYASMQRATQQHGPTGGAAWAHVRRSSMGPRATEQHGQREVRPTRRFLGATALSRRSRPRTPASGLMFLGWSRQAVSANTALLRDAMCAAADVVNLISSDEEPDDEPHNEPHNVPLALQRPRRPSSRPDLLMHQSTANGATKPMPAKRAGREQVAMAGSKGAATSSSARAGSRSLASSSSRASSSSGNHGEVLDVPQIANMRIKVWWAGDMRWCAACQDSALPTCRPDRKALRTAGT